MNDLAIFSTWTSDWEPLAKLTVDINRKEYCDRHKIMNVCNRTEEKDFEKICISKFENILKFLKYTPRIKWAWSLDVDGMFTNMIASLLLNLSNANLFVSEDNQGANFGSFLIRNNKTGISLLEDVIKNGIGKNDHELFERLSKISLVQLMPQRFSNSYDYKLYPDNILREHFKHLTKDGQWEKGDLFIHWPGRTLEQRIAHYHEYEKEIVR